MQFYCGLALGMILSRLYQEQFFEIAGLDGSNSLLTALTVLQNGVFDDDIIEKEGAVIGYGLAISSMISHDSRKDSNVHGLMVHKKIMAVCSALNQEELSTIVGQAHCFALASVTLNAFVAQSIDIQTVHECFATLQQKVALCPQVGDCLNVLLFALHFFICITFTSFKKSVSRGAICIVCFFWPVIEFVYISFLFCFFIVFAVLLFYSLFCSAFS